MSNKLAPCGCDISNGFDPDIESLNLDCSATWDLIRAGNTVGCFQLESRLGRTACKKARPGNINELADVITIIRPSALEAKMGDGKNITEHYYKRKSGEESSQAHHPALEPILADTYGLGLFQEQNIRIGQELAGMSESDADYYLRKCLAGDSLVYTNLGPRYIKDLVGTRIKILTTGSDGKLKFDYATFSKSGSKKIFEVKTKDGYSIRATGTHPFYTQDAFKEVKDLSTDDSLLILGGDLDAKELDKLLDIEPELSKIKSIEASGEEETYDFHMEGKEKYAFINGILVHNSIGKKKASILSECESKFMQGAARVGKLNSVAAQEIFDWIKAGARYGFNKSVTEDTTVETSNGTKKITDVKVGDRILCPEGDVEVINVYDHGLQEVYKVTLEDGKTIECTQNHKFLCENGSVEKLSTILKNDLKIITCS